MAKKHKHPEHENLERWLVSYADFMTLLFATFTALYALAQTDAAKLKDVSAAIREGFEEQSLMNGIKSILQGTNPPSRNPDPSISKQTGEGSGVVGKFDSMTYKPGEVKSMEHLVDDLTSDLKGVNEAIKATAQSLNPSSATTGAGSEGKTGAKTEDPETAMRPIEAAVQERGIRISFDSRLLFTPGSASLRAEGLKFLDVVAVRLKKFDSKRIHIEGHTDDTPIATAMYPSNWELSASRASSVVRYFIGAHQFNPSSLVAVGYGSTQPISTNQTAEGRSKNRRVDLILCNEKTSMLMNPKVQYLNEKPLNTLSDEPGNKNKTALPVLPPAQKDGPVRVIIKDKDGTEKVLIPKTKVMTPTKTDAGTPIAVKTSGSTLTGPTLSGSSLSSPGAPVKTKTAPKTTQTKSAKIATPSTKTSTPPVPGGHSTH